MELNDPWTENHHALWRRLKRNRKDFELDKWAQYAGVHISDAKQIWLDVTGTHWSDNDIQR